MNENNRGLSLELIDLLAENELNAADREGLFASLDREPGGWKSCALTLLETNALRSSLGNGRSSNTNRIDQTDVAVVVRSRRKRKKLLRIAGIFAAACLLVWLGIGIGQYRQSPTVFGLVAGNETTNTTRQPGDMISRHLANEDPDLMRQFNVDLESIGATDIQVIAYFGTEENNRPRIYPIIKSDKLARQLANTPTARLPKEVTEQLKKNGWRVASQRHLLAIARAGGMQSTVPVETLNYEYVGRQTF